MGVSIMTREEYDKLIDEQKSKIEFSNPCTTQDDDMVRVGQVFDSDLGHWRTATREDF